MWNPTSAKSGQIWGTRALFRGQNYYRQTVCEKCGLASRPLIKPAPKVRKNQVKYSATTVKPGWGRIAEGSYSVGPLPGGEELAPLELLPDAGSADPLVGAIDVPEEE